MLHFMEKKFLAFDFGASGGRAILGKFNGEKISLTQLHRFANEPVMLGDTFYWDTLRLFHEIKLGISKSIHTGNKDIVSMGIDTWGVDFGLLDKYGDLLENPVHYRDKRTDNMPDKVFKKVSKQEIYNSTGIQFMNLNTIFQLSFLAENRPDLLSRAKDMLFMPDLFSYFLTRQKVQEYSISSTTQLFDPVNNDWAYPLIEKLGLPSHLFRNVTDAGTKVGTLIPSIANELNANEFDVFAVTGHDTAAAVVSVPARKGSNYAYLSCGTWSLLGLELEKPIINNKSFEYNFTNEGGYGRKIRFLKNIIGLWLMQESKRQWEREGDNISFKDIDQLTVKAEPLKRFINPDFVEFSAPGNMPKRIAEYCIKTGQTPPHNKGEFARCITESLALKYRMSIELLEEIKGSSIDVIHIIGGGVQDKMLCQFTANATKKVVIAGPIEATAIGNIAVQLIANGEFKNIDEARNAIKKSFPTDIYEPQDTNAWDYAYEKFLKIIESEDNL
jgi:rhamnulokinase